MGVSVFHFISLIKHGLQFFQFKCFDLVSPVCDFGVERFTSKRADIVVALFNACTVL